MPSARGERDDAMDAPVAGSPAGKGGYPGPMHETLLHGLFPVVRAEVLRLLFTNPRQELEVRELTRLSFLSLRTGQDELCVARRRRSHRKPQQWISALLFREPKPPALCHIAKASGPRRSAPFNTSGQSPIRDSRIAPSTQSLLAVSRACFVTGLRWIRRSHRAPIKPVRRAMPIRDSRIAANRRSFRRS